MCEFDLNSSKKIKWIIDTSEIYNLCRKQKINIHDALFKKVEYAGNFEMHQISDRKKCTSLTNCTFDKVNRIKMGSMNKGSTSSVKTKHGYCNFHTHPIICYEGMGNPEDATIWGWPSGEDMREAIMFLTRGNIIHLIFTLEGIYAIQVNPYFVNILLNDKYFNDKKLGEKRRGMVVSLIENYFKSTHGYRNVDYNTNICRNNQKCLEK